MLTYDVNVHGPQNFKRHTLYWVWKVLAFRAALTISATLRVFFHIFMGKISTKAHKTQFAGQSINIVFIVLGKYNFVIALPLVAPSIVLMTLL